MFMTQAQGPGRIHFSRDGTDHVLCRSNARAGRRSSSNTRSHPTRPAP